MRSRVTVVFAAAAKGVRRGHKEKRWGEQCTKEDTIAAEAWLDPIRKSINR